MTLQETMTILLNAPCETAPRELVVPRRVGNVRIGEVLGEGTGGVVLAAFDEALGRRVAVKLLHGNAMAQGGSSLHELVDGVRSAARVRHPNIVMVYSVETFNGMPVIVMELVDGISLRELLVRGGRLENGLALFVLSEICEGVEALHAANIVHRDLKPANILFDRVGAVRICDFGLACEFDVARIQGRISAVGGSPLYMAPEMFEGHVSPASDVYALGVMLFEMLAGRPPFSADSIQLIRTQHAQEPIPLNLLERVGVPDGLREVVERAMHKQRLMRYKTAAHLHRALQPFALPAARADALRMRIAEVVSVKPQPPPAVRDPGAETGALTTYDLLAARAKQKRERGPDRGQRPS